MVRIGDTIPKPLPMVGSVSIGRLATAMTTGLSPWSGVLMTMLMMTTLLPFGAVIRVVGVLAMRGSFADTTQNLKSSGQGHTAI